jgi:hypothetical protein
MKSDKQKIQIQEEEEKIDISHFKVITHNDDPQKLVHLKNIIHDTKIINEQIVEQLVEQSHSIDKVVESAEVTNDNVQKGNKIMAETSKKYGFFKILKMKLATFFGVAGAATGHPVVGALMGAGAYGLGQAAENRNNTQLDKID